MSNDSLQREGGLTRGRDLGPARVTGIWQISREQGTLLALRNHYGDGKVGRLLGNWSKL